MSLAAGEPALDCFPTEAFHRAMNDVLAKDAATACLLIDALLAEEASYEEQNDTMNASAQVARAAKVLVDFAAAGIESNIDLKAATSSG